MDLKILNWTENYNGEPNALALDNKDELPEMNHLRELDVTVGHLVTQSALLFLNRLLQHVSSSLRSLCISIELVPHLNLPPRLEELYLYEPFDLWDEDIVVGTVCIDLTSLGRLKSLRVLRFRGIPSNEILDAFEPPSILELPELESLNLRFVRESTQVETRLFNRISSLCQALPKLQCATGLTMARADAEELVERAAGSVATFPDRVRGVLTASMKPAQFVSRCLDFLGDNVIPKLLPIVKHDEAYVVALIKNGTGVTIRASGIRSVARV